MKKILALLLAAIMLLSVVACAPADNTTTPGGDETPGDEIPGGDETPGGNETPGGEEEPEGPVVEYFFATADGNGNYIPTPTEQTTAAVLWNAFYEAATTAIFPMDAENMAGYLMMQPYIPFMGGGVPVDPEFFEGFGEYVITGFETGARFQPMIGSIPFLGYIFDLAEGADVEAFMKQLTDNCNSRWMICVEADQVVVGAVGNQVFFLMCPHDLISSATTIVTPEVDEGTVAMDTFNSFVEIMEAGTAATAGEIAAALEGFTASDVTLSEEEETILDGLKYGFYSWDVNGVAKIANDDGSVYGYVIEIPGGVDPAGWASWYATPADGNEKTIAFGAYNSFILLIAF